MDGVVRTDIKGKPIFTFEDHASALQPWAEIRKKQDKAPNLLTFDFHTDTHTAFTGNIYEQFGDFPVDFDALVDRLCGEIDFRNYETVVPAIQKLRNDEQIDAAIRSGIIENAFVISYGSHFFDENRCFAKKMFEIDSDAGYSYSSTLPEHEIREHSDLAIESEYLKTKIDLVNGICRRLGYETVFSHPFILDIDLDYFRTIKSISPSDASVFCGMIKVSLAITIAEEPKFVKMERLDEELTSEYLKAMLFKQIDMALD